MSSNVQKAGSTDSIVLGMGCFWGAEKRMAAIPGVLDVESGYANGDVAGTYDTVLAHERMRQWGKSSLRNHAEVVKVTFDPAKVDLETVLIHFWESHNPTQGDRQGNDVGSNYRSAVYTHDASQQAVALKTRDTYQAALTAAGLGRITTEIAPLEKYFTAEDYHQDYLVKHPDGYCGLGGTGVSYPRQSAPSGTPVEGSGKGDDYWRELGRQRLTPAQWRIAFEQGTEYPGTGCHLAEKRPGTFVDPLSGAPLFRSDAKYESGSGWPSFFNPLPGAITLHEDDSHGMRRVEVRSASSGIHLGHVFDDGPPPTGKRYCINGNVLEFVPDQAS